MAKTNRNTEQPQIIDLGSVLGEEVNVTPMASFIPETETFEVELEPEPEPVITETIDTDTETGHQNQEPQSLSPDDIAVIAVNILDGIQRFGFAIARKKMVFSDEELEVLGNIDLSEKVLYQPGSKEAILKDKFKKHLDVVKNLPFDEGEKQRLTDATKIYARTTQLKVSPLTGLIAAYTEVLGMRAVNVFSE